MYRKASVIETMAKQIKSFGCEVKNSTCQHDKQTNVQIDSTDKEPDDLELTDKIRLLIQSDCDEFCSLTVTELLNILSCHIFIIKLTYKFIVS